MDYEKKVAEALEELKQCARYDTEPAKTILKLFPELEESDYVIKRRLRHLLDYFRCKGVDHDVCDRILRWLDKQGSTSIIPIPDGCHAYIKDRKVYIESYTKTTPTDKIEPKFQTGDTMRTLEEARDGFTSGMPMVVSIDDEYYHCTNESIAIKDQDNYEYPPINRKETDNKINHRFKPGDWIVNGSGEAAHIAEVKNDRYGTLRYYLEWVNGRKSDPTPGFVDNDFHLWTLENANDGEILIHRDIHRGYPDDFDYIFIYNKTGILQAYCYYSKKENRVHIWDPSCLWSMQDVIMPATKKQCDFLIQRMKEIGCGWDADNKTITWSDIRH